MGDEGPPLGVGEHEGEGVERLRRAHPGELVGAYIDLRGEVRRVFFANARVDAIAHHDQVGVGKARLVVDVRFEMQFDAELASTLLQDQEQRAPGAAAEAVAADAVGLTLEVDGDVVPIGEFLRDPAVARRIVALERVERRIGEHHAEAERVVGAVALVHHDLVRGILLLHQDREIEAGRASPDDGDFHGALRCWSAK